MDLSDPLLRRTLKPAFYLPEEEKLRARGMVFDA